MYQSSVGNKRFVPPTAYVKNNSEPAKPFQDVYTEKLRHVLEDYNVYVKPEIKEALMKRGHSLLVIGGGVTGDVQLNYTDVQSPLKAKYRQLEQDLIILQLIENTQKILQQSKNDMTRILDENFRSLKIDFASRFRCL